MLTNNIGESYNEPCWWEMLTNSVAMLYFRRVLVKLAIVYEDHVWTTELGIVDMILPIIICMYDIIRVQF